MKHSKDNKKRIVFFLKDSKYNVFIEAVSEVLNINPEKYEVIKIDLSKTIRDFHKIYKTTFLYKFKSLINYLAIPDEGYRQDWRRDTKIEILCNILVRETCFHRTHLFKKFIIWSYRQIDRISSINTEVRNICLESKPDVAIIFPTNWSNSYEYEFLRALRSQGIPAINPIMSIDNIYTKGRLLENDQFICVWNEKQRKFLLNEHSFPNKNVIITGSLFFESFLQHSSRKAENRSSNPSKLTLLYLISSPRISNSYGEKSERLISAEYYAIERLIWELEKLNALNSEMQITLNIRTHPSSKVNEQMLRISKKIDIKLIESEFPEWKSNKHQAFVRLLKQSDCIFGLNTSALIAATLCNVNCYALTDDRLDYVTKNTTHMNTLFFEKSIRQITFNEICEKLQHLDLNDTQTQQQLKKFLGLTNISPSRKLLQLIESLSS
jgi:hypothetical protein